MYPTLLRYLALEEEEGIKVKEWTQVSNDSVYHFVIHPSLALECINTLIALKYSIHAVVNDNSTAIRITVKNKKKQTVNISNEAKKLMQKYL